MSRAAASIHSALNDPRIIRAVVLFVSAGVLLYLSAIFWFGWKETVAALSSIGLDIIVAGALLSSTSYLWRFGRWESSLRRFGEQIPLERHLAIYLSGLGLTATPGKSGETFRSALLLQHGVRVPRSLAAFIVDRASDVLGMCLLGLVAAWMAGQVLAWAWLSAFTALLLSSCTVAHLLRQPSKGGGGSKSRAWQRLPLKGGQAILESWASLWKVPRVAGYSILAAIAYGTQALVFAWFCAAAGTGVPPATCVLIFVQATLFGAATLLPGGLGAMEAALAIQLTRCGVDSGVAVSMAIAIRLVTLWLGMAIGALSLLVSSRAIRDNKAQPSE